MKENTLHHAYTVILYYKNSKRHSLTDGQTESDCPLKVMRPLQNIQKT